MKKLFSIVAILLLTISVNAQENFNQKTGSTNLILNGSFEIVDTTVPPSIEAAIPWISPQWGSPDLFLPTDSAYIFSSNHTNGGGINFLSMD